jgi:hypothetical protein
MRVKNEEEGKISLWTINPEAKSSNNSRYRVTMDANTKVLLLLNYNSVF